MSSPTIAIEEEIDADARPYPLETDGERKTIAEMTPDKINLNLTDLEFLVPGDFEDLDKKMPQILDTEKTSKSSFNYFAAIAFEDQRRFDLAWSHYHRAANGNELLALLRLGIYYRQHYKNLSGNERELALKESLKYLNAVLNHSHFNNYFQSKKQIDLFKSTLLHCHLLMVSELKTRAEQLALLNTQATTYLNKSIDMACDGHAPGALICCDLSASFMETFKRYANAKEIDSVQSEMDENFSNINHVKSGQLFKDSPSPQVTTPTVGLPKTTSKSVRWALSVPPDEPSQAIILRNLLTSPVKKSPQFMYDESRGKEIARVSSDLLSLSTNNGISVSPVASPPFVPRRKSSIKKK